MYPPSEFDVPAGYDPFDLEDLPSRGRLMSWSDRQHAQIVKAGLWKEALQGYSAAMSYVDEQIGRVLDALQSDVNLRSAKIRMRLVGVEVFAWIVLILPVGTLQGGGFGPTVRLDYGKLATSYSYRGEDGKSHLEVARWELHKSR